jgi:hypothetical protein
MTRRDTVPTHYDVTISVDQYGNFTYSPTDLRAAPDDTVSFITAPRGGPPGPKFEVMFKHRTPGNRTHIRHDTAEDQGGGGGASAGHLKCGNDLGQYKYGAAIYDGTHVFIDAGCGHIGVGNNR